MKSLWRETALGDEVEILTGFPFKSSSYIDGPDGIRLLRGDNVVQGALRWEGVKLWPLQAAQDLERYHLQEGDVVLAMDRPWIDAGLKYAALSTHDLPALLVQRVSRLRGGPNLHTRFLRYLIGSKAFTDHVLAVQTGTAVPHISADQIRSFRFRCPPLAQQLSIADILGTLDDRIELNRRTNETIEAMARALFKSWFLDFDPVRAKADIRAQQPKWTNAQVSRAALPNLEPDIAEMFPDAFQGSALGKIPVGWNFISLRDVIEIFDSKRIPLSGRQRQQRQGAYPYYGAASVMDHVDAYLFDGVHVLMGEDGSVLNDDGTPVLQYVWGRFWVNNHAHVLRGANHVSTEHIYLHLRNSNITAFVTGAVQPKLNQGNMNRIQFLKSPSDIEKAFAHAISPLFEQIRQNSDQTRALTLVRDRLLPRLLSGDLQPLSHIK
ncbi:MAG: restriction endonuclease subunit S [Pirellulaceae bacterium]|nr:restriction endonuclease subunit S [Pirellulaceae bacterium]